MKDARFDVQEKRIKQKSCVYLSAEDSWEDV